MIIPSFHPPSFGGKKTVATDHFPTANSEIRWFMLNKSRVPGHNMNHAKRSRKCDKPQVLILPARKRWQVRTGSHG